MENFFSNALDYNLFKKALKSTDGETVVINILASDESLKTPSKQSSKKQRKSMSSKFEPSPFGKFFGSKQATAVDMSDFSGWKNKNYRKTEESFEDVKDESSFFSLSNYMKDNSKETYNELDQARNDIVKPITQLDSEDPTYQKFSLDGYMHKLEESILAKDKFTQNEDLLEPIVSSEDYIDERANREINKSQDENFFDFNHDIETFAFDENTSGTNYKMDNDELDKVKDRLARLEMEARNLKMKSTEKLITGDELTETAETKEEKQEEKDAFDDLIITKAEKGEEISGNIEKAETPVTKKSSKLNEVVMHTETSKVGANNIQRPVLISTDDINTTEPLKIIAETKSSENDETLRRDEVLTKEDFRDMTNEFMSKFSEMLAKPQQAVAESEYTEEYEPNIPQIQEGFVDYNELLDYKNNQDEMKLKINELVESKNRTEKETQEKLKKIEEEKQKIDEEYKNKLKEMEESYSKKYEEFKQKMYLDKLSTEREIKKADSKIKNAQIERSKLSYKQVGAILKKELKSNFNISNLEMEKKLLECSSQLSQEENIKLKEDLSKQAQPQKKVVRKAPVVVVRETVQTVAPAPAPTPAPAKKPTKPRTKKKTKRKIDSDIIGGISF